MSNKDDSEEREYYFYEKQQEENEYYINLDRKISGLEQKLEKAIKALEFYANGGNHNLDIWHDEKLGYFTGKRARQVLKEIKGE